MTIDSDVEDSLLPSSSKTGKNVLDSVEEAKLDPDFVFDASGDPYVDFSTEAMGFEDLVKTGSKPVRF